MFKLLEMIWMGFLALIYISLIVTLGMFIGMLQILGLNKDGLK